ncbi:hypothetical protein HAX54_003552 [Datura stramonium]|uniref:Uncharacterized protein n=1 Tax=Datura stramonium TaxID=4076 RepID=A0ABS8T6M5_DATST|nr:hypothetical protein [Datura stramonium]
MGIWGMAQVFTDYSLSKLAANAYTRLMARILSRPARGHKGIYELLLSGWVKTAMTAWAGHTSPEVELLILQSGLLLSRTSFWVPSMASETDSTDPIPAPWPEQFHAITIMNYTGGLRKVDLWYDWPNKRLLASKPIPIGKILYDVEWENGTSFYFTLDSTQECTIRQHFSGDFETQLA